MGKSKAVSQEEKPVRGKLLTIPQAAEMIPMSKSWIYRHIDKRTLPFPWFMSSLGKCFIDSADIDDWLRGSKQLGSHSAPSEPVKIISSIRGRLLTVTEVAKILNMSRAAVYEMARKSIIPYHQISCSIRFDSADIDDYLFFSKFGNYDFRLKNSDKEMLFERLEERHWQLKSYLEKLLSQGRNE